MVRSVHTLAMTSTTTPPSSESLVDALRSGDQDAYRSFFHAQRPVLLRLGLRLLRNEQEAEDCFQEVMLRIPRALDSFDGRASLGTWTFRIMRNTCLMRLRRRRRRPEVLADPHVAPLAVVGPDAERALEVDDCRRMVRAALGRLPASYREVLWLRDFEQLCTNAVAGRLGISIANVRVRLHRARAALREELERSAEESWLRAYRTRGRMADGRRGPELGGPALAPPRSPNASRPR
jgi:RNA polymerase sigma-70 factor (ECF subfamily)